MTIAEVPIEGPPAVLHNPIQDWLIDRRNREGLRRLKQLAERLTRRRRPPVGARERRASFAFARSQTQVKLAWRKSLPAEAASTVVTIRPAGGECSRSATSPSALQAPMQRVQLSSSPTA